MLIIGRKIEQGLKIGDTIEIRVLDIYSTDHGANKKTRAASIGIEAPKEISILRRELKDTLSENQEAVKSVRDLTGTGLAGLLRQRRTLGGPTGIDTDLK